VGNWLSWEPLKWQVKDSNGENVDVDVPGLLARTVLYKAGHHASHNATLRDKGLELMKSPELCAMIPVYEEQAHKQGKDGWEMPFGPLLKRLEEKTSNRILRADQGVHAGWPKTRKKKKYLQTEDAIDYLVDM
jgi:hypothetical protein